MTKSKTDIIKGWLDKSERDLELTVFAVESRYPEFSEPSLPDTNTVIKIAEKFKKYILKKIIF